MKPYPKYKPSGIEWIDNIPEYWEAIKLKYVVSKIGSGVTPKGGADVYQTSGIPLLRSQNVHFDAIHTEDIAYITDEVDEMMSNSRTSEGDVLLNITGASIGRCNYIDGKFGRGNVNQHVCIIRPRTNLILTQFLYYLIRSDLGQKQVAYYSSGANREGLNFEQIKNFAINLPPLDEQLCILIFLDDRTSRIDRLISKKLQLIELLEEERTAVINEAVTKGLNPDVKMKDSGIPWLGEIPKHWIVTKLGFLSTIKARLGWKGLKASEYVESGYIFLSTPNIKGKVIDFENVYYINEERYLESPEIMLAEGDVLLVKDGSTLGIVNVIRNLPAPATVNSSIAVIKCYKELDPVYLFYYLQSSFIQNHIQLMKGGMGVPHLFQADIKKFVLTIPPKNEQEEISSYLDAELERMEGIQNKIKVEINLLQEYRKSLISEAVTGKIDVRDYNIPV